MARTFYLGTFFFNYKLRISGIFGASMFAFSARLWLVLTDVDGATWWTIKASVAETITVVFSTPFYILKLGAGPILTTINHTVTTVLVI